ncbi:MAG: hypothetical protein ACTHNN_07370 [Xanthobacteraceae bacterium]
MPSFPPAGYYLRKLGAFCIAFSVLTGSAAAQVKDHLNIPGPIAFDGQSYDLAWSSRPSASYIKHEYVPKGQVVTHFHDMLLVEFLQGDRTVANVVQTQMQKLNARKDRDPLVRMAVIKNDATGEMLLDFLMSDNTGSELIVEWNAYRYARISNANGEAGIGLFGISRRAYGNDNAKAFLAALKTRRPAQINHLAKAPMPFASK